MNEDKRYLLQRHLLMTLDPVHPGAGGYRLGRVDNSIAREPGTRLPKIPGTSLHGAARSYAAYLYETPECAGQGPKDEKEKQKLGDPSKNPVCYTFGYIRKDDQGNEQKAFSGVVNIFDARILLFPVHSARGPVWVSTAARLKDAGFTLKGEIPLKNEEILTTGVLPDKGERLNLGWLMLEVVGQVAISTPEGTDWGDKDRWKAIQDRIVLVTDALFGQVVNSNLEVRTSVSINPKTGAAEDKALFTYEAIPRATFLTAEMVLDDYRQQFPPNARWQGPLDVVRAGLGMMAYLGVGGMGTRGFGRVALVGKPIEEDPTADNAQEAPDA